MGVRRPHRQRRVHAAGSGRTPGLAGRGRVPHPRLPPRRAPALRVRGAAPAFVPAVSGAELAVRFLAPALLMITLAPPPPWLRRSGPAGLPPAAALAGGAAPWVTLTASAGVLIS